MMQRGSARLVFESTIENLVPQLNLLSLVQVDPTLPFNAHISIQSDKNAILGLQRTDGTVSAIINYNWANRSFSYLAGMRTQLSDTVST